MYDCKGKILYITAQTPTGKGETFILTELIMLINIGAQLLIIPRNPIKKIFHEEAHVVLKDSKLVPLISFKIVLYSLLFIIKNTRLTYKLIKDIFTNSRKLGISLKNLVVLPKTLYLSKILKDIGIRHIHSHWGSTTSTMAYIFSKITTIPWSFTLHRWDIKENNLLKNKIKSAEFVRCISEHGKKELIEIVGYGYEHKIFIVHMGVNCDSFNAKKSDRKKEFIIIVPANLIPVKGHIYLLKACSLLINQGVRDFKCYFFGEGILRRQLLSYIDTKKLNGFIEVHGQITHRKLMEMYAKKQVDVVIMPSINTPDGDHEGIPVSLMEAMIFRIPVISTNTGGIPELLRNGNGIIVEEKNSKQLAEAILRIKNEIINTIELSERGRTIVRNEFNIEKNSRTMLNYFKNIYH